MKTLLFFLLIPMSLMAQKNTISVVFHPTDLGYGLRYDRQIQNFGIYATVSKGYYNIRDFVKIDNHVKFVIGGMRIVKNHFDDLTRSYISAGLSYHHYSNIIEELDKKVFWSYSFDLGTGIKFGHCQVGFVFDFIKNEGGVNFGVSF